MPKSKKSRKTSHRRKLSWRILFASFIPVLVIAFLLFNSSSNQNVLGESDTNLFNVGKRFFSDNTTPKPTPTCTRVRVYSIAFTNPCESRGNVGFKQIDYSCSDGTKGSFSGNCLNAASALEKIGKTCAKNSKCNKPSISPKPTKTPSPSPEFESE